MYTKSEILSIAKTQLALDYNCQISDFKKEENIITENKLLEGRRINESDGCFLKIITIGGKAIICADEKIRPWIEEKILKKNALWLFDYGNLRMIDNKLREFGHEIDEMPHFYLPNPVTCEIKPMTTIKWFEKEEILQFKDDSRFEQAFVFDENYPDVLGVAAYDGDNIMGMAGSSEDSKTLYQIGIDVLPEYRGKGIGTNLVALLKQELLKRGKIPFYGTSVSNINSKNVAINAGFFPVWAEVYSKKL
ncbi:GNAT family N-acetyltransferase [Tissierella pigra]|uniref:GNAT family N-acetyltransferase n=1 Tax=Tissierella pigra TaxID=2607614 RepID=A0A6N7XNP4_9FIRM|nr:GNAT family N-acetyltransferase [Tissierella pigra]MBU5428270.1 GNAT family N-acetyltransferase [Tissierella pigra]MSU02432.1 GNAT family N-acetyltransferase [Tissierella pigra]